MKKKIKNFFTDLRKSAYGYGPLETIDKYIEENISKNHFLVHEKNLNLELFSMKELETGVGNCSLVAITRVLLYYRSLGYDRIPEDIHHIYPLVKHNGLKNYYSPKRGTLPSLIARITDQSLRDLGYSNNLAYGVYFWTFHKEVLEEINLGYPLIFNISRGYYKNHSVVVSGYSIHSVDGCLRRFLIIHDGWHRKPYFLDYDRFSKNLVLAGLGSFNKLRIG